jgi:hypothetical protein
MPSPARDKLLLIIEADEPIFGTFIQLPLLPLYEADARELVIIFEDHSLPGFAGAERGSRVSHIVLDRFCDRVRTPEHAPRDPPRVLEHRQCLAEIVERGAGVAVSSTRSARHAHTNPRPPIHIKYTIPYILRT